MSFESCRGPLKLPFSSSLFEKNFLVYFGVFYASWIFLEWLPLLQSSKIVFSSWFCVKFWPKNTVFDCCSNNHQKFEKILKSVKYSYNDKRKFSDLSTQKKVLQAPSQLLKFILRSFLGVQKSIKKFHNTPPRYLHSHTNVSLKEMD